MDAAAWIALVRLILRLLGVENVSPEAIAKTADALVAWWKALGATDVDVPTLDDLQVPEFEAFLDALDGTAEALAAKEEPGDAD